MVARAGPARRGPSAGAGPHGAHPDVGGGAWIERQRRMRMALLVAVAGLDDGRRISIQRAANRSRWVSGHHGSEAHAATHAVQPVLLNAAFQPAVDGGNGNHTVARFSSRRAP